MGKFQTTNSVLFNNNNSTNIPDWMQSLGNNVNNKKQKNINLEFEKRGSFADTTSVFRTECTATPRGLDSDFNSEKAILDSKVELAKFLKGRYYKANARVVNDSVLIDTTIDGLQANFTFNYDFKNGKMVQASTFLINDTEYPFSYAGFEESIEDLKNGTIKKSRTKVASTSETYVIHREEIVRRFNGHLREAIHVINKKLKHGEIIGVGSNSYASYYNPDELFPQIEKEIPETVNGSFEFVNNTEHVKTNEYKSARNLSFIAGRLISKLFIDYIINSFSRNNNVLTVEATVLNSKTGIRHNISFNFDIINENINSIKNAVFNNSKLTVDELLEKLNNRNNLVSDYLKTSTASKRIYSGGVLTKRDIINQLLPIVGQSKVDDFISSWLDLNMITQVGLETYSTNKTFPELLDVIVSETLSQDEKDKIINLKKKFGEGLDIERIEQEDTGVRESNDIELSREAKLSIINNELSKKFKNYQITAFKNNVINATFINDGIRHNIKLKAKFVGRKLDKISAIIKEKNVELDNLIKAFEVNPLLKSYVQENSANNYCTTIIATESTLLERLSQLTSNPNEILNQWKNKYLTSLGSNLYSSKYSFEELLNKTNATLLSDKDKQQILIAKQYFGNALERIAQKDTGIRDMESVVTNETLLYAANNHLSKHFNNYTPYKFSSLNNTANYTIELFDDSTGLSCIIDFEFKFINNKVLSCNAKINNNLVSLDNVKVAFAMNESLNKYLQSNNSKKFNAPMVITKKDLFRRLSSISNLSETDVDNIVENWRKQGKVSLLSNNVLAAKMSLEKLISESNIKPLDDREISLRLEKSRRDKLLTITSNHIKDNDTRRPEVILSPGQMSIHARSAIGLMFADFDILDAELNDDNYLITARIINPINGLRQTLCFEFDTDNGKKVGEIKTVSNGEKTVDIKDILSLLETNNKAVEKFVKINSNSVSKRQYKTIITQSSLKSKLLALTDLSTHDKIINDLVESGIMTPIGSEKFACEYSLTDLVEYLSNNDKLNLIEAEKNMNTYSKDTVVCTDVPVVMDCDNRKIEKPAAILSPKMLKTVDKLQVIVKQAKLNKKITNNKFNYFNESLSNCKTSNDVENVWREIKKYL